MKNIILTILFLSNIKSVHVSNFWYLLRTKKKEKFFLYWRLLAEQLQYLERARTPLDTKPKGPSSFDSDSAETCADQNLG